MYILDFLNKIKYDKRENPKDYTISYFDRILEKTLEIKFLDIKRIEGNFIILERGKKEVNIPLHRIREIRKKGKLVWERG